ncbi:23340_t:CDS:2, partial [Gigaspora rosea]
FKALKKRKIGFKENCLIQKLRYFLFKLFKMTKEETLGLNDKEILNLELTSEYQEIKALFLESYKGTSYPTSCHEQFTLELTESNDISALIFHENHEDLCNILSFKSNELFTPNIRAKALRMLERYNESSAYLNRELGVEAVGDSHIIINGIAYPKTRAHEFYARCPNALEIYGVTYYASSKKYMMVMEYGDCGDLRSYLSSKFSSLKWKDKISLLYKIAENVKDLHLNAHFVHKDLHSDYEESYEEIDELYEDFDSSCKEPEIWCKSFKELDVSPEDFNNSCKESDELSDNSDELYNEFEKYENSKNFDCYARIFKNQYDCEEYPYFSYMYSVQNKIRKEFLLSDKFIFKTATALSQDEKIEDRIESLNKVSNTIDQTSITEKISKTGNYTFKFAISDKINLTIFLIFR